MELLPHVPGGYFLPFHLSHLNNMDGLESYRNSSMGSENFEKQLLAQSISGPAVTAFVYGKPVAVFGCMIMWKGVGEAWSILSDSSKRYPIALIRGARAFLDSCTSSYHLHRLQITVKTSDAVAIKFAYALKFIPECNMEKYSADQEDYTLFRRT
jgi:hypothetical protein